MKSILVAGATGGIGQIATDYALSKGCRVIALGRRTEKLEELGRQGATTLIADINEIPEEFIYQSLKGVDAVWNCAGSLAGDKHQLTLANVTLAATLFRLSAKAKVPVFVHISSPSIYFEYRNQYSVPETFKAKKPASLYAASKLEAETFLLNLSKQYPGTKLVILRPKTVYGPADSTFMPGLYATLKERNGKLTLPKRGLVLFDMCSQQNLSHAMWLASWNKGVASGTAFNISDGQPLVLIDVINRFAQGLKLSTTISDVPFWVLRPLLGFAHCFGYKKNITTHALGAISYACTLDISKARSILGYNPVLSPERSMKIAIERFIKKL